VRWRRQGRQNRRWKRWRWQSGRIPTIAVGGRFIEVVEALAQAGQFEQALEVAAEQIEDSDSRWWAVLCRWRWRWRRQGRQNRRWRWQRSRLRMPTRRSAAFGAVALALAQAGQAEQALAAGGLRMPTSVAYGAVADWRRRGIPSSRWLQRRIEDEVR
jgi:hypothetical protein